MPRFTAPADTGGITLSTGFHAVENGVVEVPDDITQGDRSGLTANGFQPEQPAPETKSRVPIKDVPEPAAAAPDKE